MAPGESPYVCREEELKLELERLEIELEESGLMRKSWSSLRVLKHIPLGTTSLTPSRRKPSRCPRPSKSDCVELGGWSALDGIGLSRARPVSRSVSYQSGSCG